MFIMNIFKVWQKIQHACDANTFILRYNLLAYTFW